LKNTIKASEKNVWKIKKHWNIYVQRKW
jgi:hypothetical protein